jgi:hypothetical protein
MDGKVVVKLLVYFLPTDGPAGRQKRVASLSRRENLRPPSRAATRIESGLAQLLAPTREN